MPGTLLAQGSLLAALNDVETELFLETRNALHPHKMLQCHPPYITWMTPLLLAVNKSFWLPLRLSSLPAAWLKGRRGVPV